jgi:glycosyltransferase involved in cell wall biosynthesis
MESVTKIVLTVEEFDPEKCYLEHYLAKELVKLGHIAYVFTFGMRKETSTSTCKDGYITVAVPHSAIVEGYHIPSLKGITHILEFIKLEKPDVIHCQPMDSPLSLFFIAWKRFFKYKVVGSLMTQLNLIYSPWGMRKKMLFSLSKIVVAAFAEKRSEIIFAKTEELADLLSQSYNVPFNKFRIVPLGSDIDSYKFDPEARIRLRKELGLSETDVVLVYSGKIDSTKGLDVLIRALAPIALRNDRVKLLVIGKGDRIFMAYLKQLISTLEVEKSVIFHPWVIRSLLPSLYSASDIGVWPGLSSISIVDAASTSLPLIISRCPVETFAIENENGLTFEIGNIEELRKCLETLIYDDKLRKEMGHKSRLLVERKLSWKTITSQYLSAYKHALSSQE